MASLQAWDGSARMPEPAYCQSLAAVIQHCRIDPGSATQPCACVPAVSAEVQQPLWDPFSEEMGNWATGISEISLSPTPFSLGFCRSPLITQWKGAALCDISRSDTESMVQIEGSGLGRSQLCCDGAGRLKRRSALPPSRLTGISCWWPTNLGMSRSHLHPVLERSSCHQKLPITWPRLGHQEKLTAAETLQLPQVGFNAPMPPSRACPTSSCQGTLHMVGSGILDPQPGQLRVSSVLHRGNRVMVFAR